jgi:DNA repair exonuclease SbcCD ATPase subunit
MTTQPPSYRRQFWKSPHHVITALATLGAGLILGADYPLALVLAPAAYALGWIYVPDLKLFRNWVDRRRDAAQWNASQAELAGFMQRRDALLDKLSSSSQRKYHTLAAVCKDIEMASADNSMTPNNPADDPRLRKLDELMWSYLRMLTIEESLERFLETERRDDVPGLLKDAEAEVRNLSVEFEALKAKGANVTALDSKERLLNSRLERLEVLRKRLQRIEQTKENLAIVVSEQERLEAQIKLIRADAVASKNADALSARIDSTVEHLNETNKWLSEMDEFKDLAGDIPPSPLRVGYESASPPIIRNSPAKSAKVRS